MNQSIKSQNLFLQKNNFDQQLIFQNNLLFQQKKSVNQSNMK